MLIEKYSKVDLAYLSRLWRDGIGTFPHFVRNDKERFEVGCQGFIGPLPSAFLDKCPAWAGCKELWQR
jgi:hypothetical protein